MLTRIIRISMQLMDKANLRQHHYSFITGIDSDLLLHLLIAKDVEAGKTALHIETGEMHGMIVVP
jgi:hypothetical protein